MDEEPEYLPVAVASTCFIGGLGAGFYQVLYRSVADDGEGCIEIRWMPLLGKGWSVWECVTEEDGLLGGICFSLVSKGYIAVATGSRVYFFTAQGRRQTAGGADDKTGPENTEMTKEAWWTFGKGCLIFEVDLFLQQHLPSRTTKYATRIIATTISAHPSNDSPAPGLFSPLNSLTIIVFASQKSSLQSFKLELTPSSQDIRLVAQTNPVNWKSEAKGALLAWSMGRKLMTGHCCEDECRSPKARQSKGGHSPQQIGHAGEGGEGEDGVEVFKSWFPRGKGSLKELVWDYGGVVLDFWER